MRRKSFPVRFSRTSLNPNQSPASRNRIEKLEERFGCEEIVPDNTCDVSHKKRHCVETSETGKGGSEFDACIVCGVSDMCVSRCSGIDCLISFHGECLTAEFGGSEDLANPFCPYCWFKFVALKSKSLREKAIEAEKAVFKYLDKDTKSKDQELQVEKDCEKSNLPLTEDTEQPEEGNGKSGEMKEDEVEASGEQERVATENSLQDAEDDDETAIVQTKVKSAAVELYSGKEHDQVQQNEKQSSRRRRRRLVKLNDDTDSEISSTKERNGEGVNEQRTSSPSEKTKNQQRKLSKATTKVAAAKSKTPRYVSFFKKDQRRRRLWTSEEEDMLKVGVETFAAEVNKNMPWRKILKMGERVFHQTRNSADLKDKWKNMIKSLH